MGLGFWVNRLGFWVVTLGFGLVVLVQGVGYKVLSLVFGFRI